MAVTKTDVINSNVHSSKRKFRDVRMTLVFALEAAFSKRSQVTCFFAPLGTGKKNFSNQFLQSFRETKCYYAIIAIKHAFLIHKHLLGPSGGVETLAFQARRFNTSLGVQQMLMHRKYFIPIMTMF